MKILVTGGAGFIGSHLCEKVLEQENEVICLDNFFTGSKKNVKLLKKFKSFKVIEHDITEPIDISVDQIYNLACPASPKYYQEDPVKTIKTNVHGAINMLELAMNNNAKILQASTSEVYGNPTIHPQHENYHGSVNPIGPRACYDEGKRASETLFFDYHRQYGIDISIARIFNTYGPRMEINDGRVISNFFVQAINNSPMTIYGTGDHSRSFCYIDDLVDGLIRLMHSNISEPVNLGNPSEVSILELAKEIKEISGSSSQIIFNDLPVDDPFKRKPDIKRAKKLLKWEPHISRSEGLLKTYSYYTMLINNLNL